MQSLKKEARKEATDREERERERKKGKRIAHAALSVGRNASSVADDERAKTGGSNEPASESPKRRKRARE